ncbi:hypothetical protein VE00_09488 [Pseudogymnoascus sp. WSF 3629]|nr:hypothetical protein VE00_09488 [Pseudogymnoascus sp. WSF 3629]
MAAARWRWPWGGRRSPDSHDAVPSDRVGDKGRARSRGARGAILVDPRSGRRGRSRATTSEGSAAAPPGRVSPNGNTERRIAASRGIAYGRTAAPVRREYALIVIRGHHVGFRALK